MSTGTSTRRTESSRGGKFCVAAGCTSTYRDNVSLHEFPREETIRRQWVNFVKAKRKDFIQPTQYSILCEKHFPPGSYPLEYEVKKSMNIPVKKKRLLRHAVPTIHTVGLAEQQEQDQSTSPGTPVLASTPLHGHVMSPPKKMRTAFRKRECARVRSKYWAFFVFLDTEKLD